MAEYIKRDAALRALCQVSAPTPSESYIVEKCIEKVNRLPMIEVVRCRHCQFAKPYERMDGLTGYYCQHPKSTFQYGTNWERLFEPIREASDFCSYGERRKGE